MQSLRAIWHDQITLMANDKLFLAKNMGAYLRLHGDTYLCPKTSLIIVILHDLSTSTGGCTSALVVAAKTASEPGRKSTEFEGTQPPHMSRWLLYCTRKGKRQSKRCT